MYRSFSASHDILALPESVYVLFIIMAAIFIIPPYITNTLINVNIVTVIKLQGIRLLIRRAAIIWKAYYNSIFRRLSGLIEVYEGIIKACAIVNSNSNKEYKRVAWKVNERDNNVWIIHALAVRYEYRGMGLATQLVKNIISYAKLENIEAIHLYVIDKNTLADKLYIRAGFKYVSTENIFYEVVGNRQFRMYEYVIE